MEQSNYSILNEGLRLYTNAIGRFVKQRLVTAFRDNWWQEGVIKAFYYPRRDLENDKAKNRVELLEPSHFVDIILRNRGLFRDTFPNRKEIESLLVLVSEFRNRLAHSLGLPDLTENDLVRALMSMEKLLSDAGLPESVEVEKLRKQVTEKAEPMPPQSFDKPSPRPEPIVRKEGPVHQPRVTLTERVRQEVIDHWITPARNRGEREITVVSGDVHKQMGLQNRYPAVCGALSHRKDEFARRAKVELMRVVGPNPGATTKFVYRLL